MRRAKRIEMVAHGFADKMFRDMLNPKYRGPNFTWAGFPAMVASLARTGLFMSFSHRAPPSKEEEKECARLARERARQLMAEHGLLTGQNTRSG